MPKELFRIGFGVGNSRVVTIGLMLLTFPGISSESSEFVGEFSLPPLFALPRGEPLGLQISVHGHIMPVHLVRQS
jgi:hypothetical protein